MKELIKELLCPTNLDNQDSIEMLETITTIGIQALIDELIDEKKATYKYVSISGSEFSHEHFPDDLKKAILGQWACNDLAEKLFFRIHCAGPVLRSNWHEQCRHGKQCCEKWVAES